MNRAIQSSRSREAVGLIQSGPDGSTSQRSDVAITPGPGTGVASDGVIHPAFPADAPAPHRSRSTTSTSQPRADNASAVQRPTAPPPITHTRTPPCLRSEIEARGERISRIEEVLGHAGDPGAAAHLGDDPRHGAERDLLDEAAGEPAADDRLVDELLPDGQIAPRVERRHSRRGPGPARGAVEPA